MAATYQDYYKTLGVARDATREDIQRAYRKLARELHPDVNKADDAQEKFATVSEAYEVLKDPEKRKLYDSLGSDWKAGQDFRPPPGWDGRVRTSGGGGGRGFSIDDLEDMGDLGGAFSDFFAQVFGGAGGARGASPFGGARHAGSRAAPRRGRDLEHDITITLEDAYLGVTRTLNVQSPDGSEKRLDVRIPPGTTDGSVVRLRGQGGASASGGEPGDLRLRVRLAPHRTFRADGANLVRTLDLTVPEAVLGAKKTVGTLAGDVTLTVPPGSQNGSKLRLRGRGMPIRGGGAGERNDAGGAHGDLLVELRVVIPKELSDQERTLYEQIREATNPVEGSA